MKIARIKFKDGTLFKEVRSQSKDTNRDGWDWQPLKHTENLVSDPGNVTEWMLEKDEDNFKALCYGPYSNGSSQSFVITRKDLTMRDVWMELDRLESVFEKLDAFQREHKVIINPNDKITINETSFSRFPHEGSWDDVRTSVLPFLKSINKRGLEALLTERNTGRHIN